MILTERRFLEDDGTQFLILEVKTKGYTYYRILRCSKMKKCTPKLMRLYFKRHLNHYSHLFDLDREHNYLLRIVYSKSKIIQIIAYTKKGGYHVLA
jgi:hypothetical protein